MNEAQHPTESLVRKTWLTEEVVTVHFSNYTFNAENEEDKDGTW